MNPWLAIPGLLVLLYAIVAWVRAAGREWDETEDARTTTRRGTEPRHDAWPPASIRQPGLRCAGTWSAAVLPLLLLAAWAGTLLVMRGPSAAGLQIGQPAPDFALTDLDGNPCSSATCAGAR